MCFHELNLVTGEAMQDVSGLTNANIEGTGFQVIIQWTLHPLMA